MKKPKRKKSFCRKAQKSPDNNCFLSHKIYFRRTLYETTCLLRLASNGKTFKIIVAAWPCFNTSIQCFNPLQDFIYPSESAEIIAKGSPKLKRSSMIGSKGNGTMDDRRTSEQTWLTETDCGSLNK